MRPLVWSVGALVFGTVVGCGGTEASSPSEAGTSTEAGVDSSQGTDSEQNAGGADGCAPCRLGTSTLGAC
jgi:hypothetical protein